MFQVETEIGTFSCETLRIARQTAFNRVNQYQGTAIVKDSKGEKLLTFETQVVETDHRSGEIKRY